MSLLDLTTAAEGTSIRLALEGELDIGGAERVEQELARIEGAQPATIVLDLSGLAFLDSTGLRIIVGADARAREQARRLVIVRGPEAVHRIFHMTRLDERLEIVDDLAAVQAAS
ncbi:MAG: STAS domain-containing protein [Conexibacter sp.]